MVSMPYHSSRICNNVIGSQGSVDLPLTSGLMWILRHEKAGLGIATLRLFYAPWIGEGSGVGGKLQVMWTGEP